jgi:hypothetical protein
MKKLRVSYATVSRAAADFPLPNISVQPGHCADAVEDLEKDVTITWRAPAHINT